MKYSSRTACLVVSVCLWTIPMIGQGPATVTSADIHQAIKKLNVLGSALYVAAHPDDENTRLISYLANHDMLHTTYLSITRGDGGQNLVGPEMRELLGVIRTQELLMARSVDGGHQLFTRANDFGYSKTPKETLEFWNKDEVMADVVWAIRKTRPDVIINRFPHEHLNGNHGHHTTSAMLSYEAFELAGDPNAYPEQLKYVDVWQPKRLYFNTFWWFYGSREAFDNADKSRMAEVEVGVYYASQGSSNNEIAARSRSMHKSQGFGSAGTRGQQMEYLDLVKGDVPRDKNDYMGGIDATWSRVKGGAHIQKIVAGIDASFDHQDPGASIASMLDLIQEIEELPESFWKERKLAEARKIVADCAGLYLNAYTNEYSAARGDSVAVTFEVTNRSAQPITLVSASMLGEVLVTEAVNCGQGEPVIQTRKMRISEAVPFSSPYWLFEEGTEGMYTVPEQTLRGLPDNRSEVGITFEFDFEGESFSLFRPLVFKATDPVKGEVYRPFEVVPPAYVNFQQGTEIFGNGGSRAITVTVKAEKPAVTGELKLSGSEGWIIEPASQSVELGRKGSEASFEFTLIPPATDNIGEVTASIEIDGQEYGYSFEELAYDHIPTQIILSNAKTRAIRVGLQKAGNRVAYIMGAGDDVPSSLEQVGYDVHLLEEDQVNYDAISTYDAVILGVRVYNTSDRIRHFQPALFDYVKNGGTLITQYNTSRRLKADQVGPYPMQLSRERVTDERSEVTILAPNHAVLNYPNKIEASDFDNWVQERGLYFPNEWSDKYTPILSMHDEGQDPAEGSLLIAKHGDGYFVYTGLSMFRQLPSGVPGAFKLFTNMISLGKSSKS